MTGAQRIVAAARGAVGARFQLHGRDPAYGLDCIGVAALALRAAGFRDAVPADYALRGGGSAGDMLALIDRAALNRVDEASPGDMMLFAVGPEQFHIAIKTDDGLVHADAMLRRVVERPGPAPWPLIAAWRLIDDEVASDRP